MFPGILIVFWKFKSSRTAYHWRFHDKPLFMCDCALMRHLKLKKNINIVSKLLVTFFLFFNFCFVSYQHRRSSEHVRERIIDQIEKSCGIEVGISNNLATEKRLPTATAEERAHHSISQIHLVCHVSYCCS